jgi:hypothetical protein
MKSFIFFAAFFVCFATFSNANSAFDEELSKKMINFVAASFIAPQTGSSQKLKCFSQAYPSTLDWKILTEYSISPCANKLSDKCGLLIATSESLKIVVVAFNGIVSATKMAGQSSGMWLSMTDFLTNSSIGKVNKNIDVVAEVFWSSKISSALKQFKGHKFIFTGHSLGGSIAALTALKARTLGELDSTNLAVYTFGEAKFGDSQLIKSFKTFIPQSFRVIHNSDVVPHLPYCDGILDFSCKSVFEKPQHHPQEIWYNSEDLSMADGQYKACSTTNGEDMNCSNSISSTIYLTNIMSAKGLDIHLHYYNHKLDIYGSSGCTSS